MSARLIAPLRITFFAAAIAAALVAVLLSPLSPFRGSDTASAFTLGGPSDIGNNSGQTLTIANEDVQLTFVSVSAGFNNEFGRALPAPVTSYFFCSSVPPGFTLNGGRFSGPQELRFYLTTPPQGSPSTPKTWYTGPGANNSDGFAHARMITPSPNYPGDPTTVQLQWEDLLNGGDLDFNDCVIDIFITPLATIEICKNVVPNDGGASLWDFTIDGPDALSDRNVDNLADNGCQVEDLLTPGNYTVTETTQTPAYNTSVSCDNGSSDTDNDVSFAVAGGDYVICTFTNTATASIQICKDVQPNDASLWNFSVAGPTNGAVNNLGDGGCQTVSALAAGNYTVTETTQSPAYSTSVSCDQGNGASATNVINFALSPGEQTTCTFVNRTTADLDVLKDFVPNDAANVTISSVICTSGSANSTDNNASEADAADFQILGFGVGATCDATETIPLGYYADQSDCDDVLIVAGQTSSCTIINYAYASIEVCKDVVPDAPFEFNIAVDDVPANGVALGDGECETWGDLQAGQHTVIEAPVNGYQPSIDCGAFGAASPGALLNIDLAPGDAAQCTVTNLFSPGPPAVGGIAGLLDASDAQPPLDGSAGTTTSAWLLAGLAIMAALIVMVAGAGLIRAKLRS